MVRVNRKKDVEQELIYGAWVQGYLHADLFDDKQSGRHQSIERIKVHHAAWD